MFDIIEKIAQLKMFNKVVVVEVEKRLRFRFKADRVNKTLSVKVSVIGSGAPMESHVVTDMTPEAIASHLPELFPILDYAGYVDPEDMVYVCTQVITRLISKLSLEEFNELGKDIQDFKELARSITQSEQEEPPMLVIVHFNALVFGETITIPMLTQLGVDADGVAQTVEQFLNDGSLKFVEVRVQ